jgi:hypothetical protein
LDAEVVVDVGLRIVGHGLTRGMQFRDVGRSQRERMLARLALFGCEACGDEGVTPL